MNRYVRELCSYPTGGVVIAKEKRTEERGKSVNQVSRHSHSYSHSRGLSRYSELSVDPI